jgi:hypothetical protein
MFFDLPPHLFDSVRHCIDHANGLRGANKSTPAAVLARQGIDDDIAAVAIRIINGLETAPALAVSALQAELFVDLGCAPTDKYFLVQNIRLENQVKVSGVHIAVGVHFVWRQGGKGATTVVLPVPPLPLATAMIMGVAPQTLETPPNPSPRPRPPPGPQPLPPLLPPPRPPWPRTDSTPPAT